MNENLLGQQIPIAIIASTIIEWLKSKPWFPFANFDTSAGNKIFAALVAIVTAIGIHATFNSVDGVLIIRGLEWRTILHGGWAAAQQYCFQHVIYKVAIRTPPQPELEFKPSKEK